MNSMRLSTIALAAASLYLLLAGACAYAQGDYPAKPIRIIVPFPPGGSNDIVARYVGQKLAARLGQQTVIDNRGGADGIIGTQIASAAPADGYTLLVSSVTHTMTPATHKKLPYDPVRSFMPVALMGAGPVMIGGFPGAPFTTLKEVIALAKAKPGALHYASSSMGGLTQFAGELFNVMTGAKIAIVAYKGGAPAITDVLAGHVPLLVNVLAPVVPHVKSGRLRLLGVGSARRMALLPDAPTIAEQGVPGYEASTWWGMLAPAGLPRSLTERLNADVNAILYEPETGKWLHTQAAEALTGTPADFAARIAADIVKWRNVAREAGISIQ
jgi:tripartite-type tricarboxylate transporter receptor subunit TctC